MHRLRRIHPVESLYLGEVLWVRFAFWWLMIILYSASVCARCLDRTKAGRSAEAADGNEAIEKCRQLKPDLVILDICMPRLNGVDAARQILKDNPAQRILVLTSVDSEQWSETVWKREFEGGFSSPTEPTT